MSTPDIPLLDPRRAAWGSIRGYLYQAELTVLRWLDLEEGEILLCEGDEDIDRILRDGLRESESVKYRERFDLGDLRSILAAFASSYTQLREQGEQRRFRLVTNVPRYAWLVEGQDLLAVWADRDAAAEHVDAIAAGLRQLLASEAKAAQALAWLDGRGIDEGWRPFIRAVEWSFDQPQIGEMRGAIESAAAGHPEAALPGELLTDRLVCAVLDASIEREAADRVLTLDDLRGLFRLTEQELDAWAQSPRALRLRATMAAQRLLDPMIRPLDAVRPRALPSRLLMAQSEAVPFINEGREAELGHLEAWCNRPDPLLIDLWTGPGGAGKTRLMIEWCKRLREQSWLAGFLGDVEQNDLWPLSTPGPPRLVVVDYPEARIEFVNTLLKWLWYHRRTLPRLRIVFLSRHADSWLKFLGGAGQSEVRDLFELVAEPQPRDLSPLAKSAADRRSLYAEAGKRFAALLGGGALAPPPEDLETDPRFERTLYVQMAALLGVLDVAPPARDILARVLDHERSAWVRTLSNLEMTPEDMEKIDVLAAVITLIGGTRSRDQAAQLSELASRDDPTLRRRARQALRRSLPDPDPERDIAPVQPDLLGEHLAVTVLQREPELLDRVLTIRAHAGPPSASRWEMQANVVEVLYRSLEHAEESAQWLERVLRYWLERVREIGDPLGMKLALGLEAVADIDLAQRVAVLSDKHSDQLGLQFTELAAVAYRLLLQEAGTVEERARLLNNLGIRLSALGRREEALAASEEAVQIRRQLSETRPEAFLPDLANSLNNLGVRLSELGRREEALAASEEAAGIYRQLSETRPEAFLPDLANSLNNLGIGLSALGRREEALAASEEAAGIYRQLSETRPEAFLPDLAMSLNNLGVFLDALGRREEALAASEEAVQIRRQLSETRPEAFLPDLASSLNNLGNRLSALGRREEALAASEEAAGIYRQLSETRPEAFLPNLARALWTYGQALADLDRAGEAVAATAEAMKRLLPLAKRWPEALTSLLRGLRGKHIEFAEETDMEPDHAVLAAVDSILAETGDAG